MAKYKVSPQLIDQVQILLRKEALLESFNPNDPSLPSPPTLNEAVSSINDPSSDDQFRCKNCSGTLLRGSESLICVYCGLGQLHEPPPQPLLFKSTIGFRLLLKSLRLDASESVGSPIGGTRSRESSLQDEISLSDLLDLDLRWPDEPKGFCATNETQLPGKNYLNLVGVDISDLLPEKGSEHASSTYKEQEVASEKFEVRETKTFPAQNLSLFENIRSEAALRSSEEENDGWEAEFQSATLSTQPELLQSSNVSKDPAANYESHVDSVLGPAEQQKSESFSSFHASRSNLSNSNENLKSGFPSNLEEPEGNFLVENVEKINESLNTSSSFDWSFKDQQQITSAGPPYHNKVGADSSDEWKEFTFGGSENNQSEPSTALNGTEGSRGPDLSDAWDDFTRSVGVDHSQLKTDTSKVPDDDFLVSLNNFTTSREAEGIQLETRSIDISQQENHRGDNPDQPHFHENGMTDKTATQADIGLWGIHLSSTPQDDLLQGKGTKLPASGSTNEVGDSYDFWNDFKSSAVVKQQEIDNIRVGDDKMSSEGDRSIDIWSDFANVGARKDQQEISGVKAVDSSRNDSHANSYASWKDESLDEWNDFAGPNGVSNSKQLGTFGAWDDFQSSNADQHLSSGRGAINQTAIESDGSFSSWNDFRSSGVKIENSSSNPNSIQDQIDVAKAPGNPTILMDNSAFSSWADYGLAKPISETQSQASVAECSDSKLMSEGHDLFYGWNDSGEKSTGLHDDQRNSNGITLHDVKPRSENDDSFDTWSDFTSSSNVQAYSGISSSTNLPGDKEATKRNDPFDTWNVFVSSSSVQSGNDAALGMENTSERNLFGIINLQGGGLSSSMHPDVLMESFTDQNRSSQVTVSPPDVPNVFRMEDGVKVDSYPEQIVSDNAPKESKDVGSSDAETLISEMHDLSFMLESSLSIPKSG